MRILDEVDQEGICESLPYKWLLTVALHSPVEVDALSSSYRDGT